MAQEVEDCESRLFHLDIKVEGFVTRGVGGRKSYTKGKFIRWDVEIGTFSLDLLVTRLANEVEWGSNQHANISFFSKILLEDVNLLEEKQMLELFDMYKSENCCQLVVVCDNNIIVCVGEVFTNLAPLYVLSFEVQTDCDFTPEAPTSTQPEPNLGDEASASEAEEADALLSEIFNNAEEYVGVDDEHMYISIPLSKPVQNNENQNLENQNADIQNVDNDVNVEPHSSELVAAKGAIPLKAEVNDADPQDVQVLHDPLNPVIVKGVVFPDIVVFSKAVRHYAVKRGFEFATLQTDTTRFIARHPGCPWRIHASKIHDQRTIQVWSPKQKRAARRPKVQRIRGVLEGGAPKNKVKCKRYGGFGHFYKTCKLAETWEEEEPATSKKRKRQEGEVTSQVEKTPKKKKTPQKRTSKLLLHHLLKLLEA
ncbi:hypothetical protein QOZ80_8AG0616470 [Eleusine coracana subsp. coracana]|nr:hypothetical protein QOZ80_8AG0616470 [Eleusine coracana subsp. coracana]